MSNLQLESKAPWGEIADMSVEEWNAMINEDMYDLGSTSESNDVVEPQLVLPSSTNAQHSTTNQQPISIQQPISNQQSNVNHRSTMAPQAPAPTAVMASPFQFNPSAAPPTPAQATMAPPYHAHPFAPQHQAFTFNASAHPSPSWDKKPVLHHNSYPNNNMVGANPFYPPPPPPPASLPQLQFHPQVHRAPPTVQERMLSNHDFCNTYTDYELENGMWVDGYNGQLFQRYPELRGKILTVYVQICESNFSKVGSVAPAGTVSNGSMTATYGRQQGSRPLLPAEAVMQNQAVVQKNDAAPKRKKKSAAASARTPVNKPLPKSSKIKAAEPSPEQNDEGEEEEPQVNDDDDDDEADAANHPPIAYIPDIASPDDARYLLAHPPASVFTSLNIKNDDLATTKNQMHHYASLLFIALQQTGSTYLPRPIKNADQELRTNVQKRYEAQQKEAMETIRGYLATAHGQKEARARCLVVFEEAIKVHDLGIKTTIYDLATAKPKPKGTHA
ncbi:hypothetical protein LTR78_009936 [Recurvomyces mirabilis]|uniref:Uncharacterized protein n=1 Tax=Recurvomyces mirabilis TaxID=574656 RepID=A0AAE0WIA0_9PEZI|nr:hypothetical protein LTR78_009936 [Recurvomyces mirabilis]KAK5160368.1 hypothetical protein LTS14_001380 [Recurvomyces mirabilis]